VLSYKVEAQLKKKIFGALRPENGINYKFLPMPLAWKWKEELHHCHSMYIAR